MAWRELKPGAGRGVDLGGAIEVVAHGELGAGALLEARQRREGHRVALAVSHVELPELLGLGPVLALGLHINLPLPAEPVEVVDEVGAHEGLERSVDIAELHPLLQHLVAVHVDEDLRHRGGEGRGDPGKFGPFARLGQEFLGVLPQEGDVLACPVLEHHGDAARGADARDGRRREGEGHPCGSFANSRFRWAMMASYFSSGFFRSSQGLRVMKKKPL